MIKQKQKWKKATTMIEYIVVLLFIIGALVVFQKYIKKGFYGQWKKAGDVFGQGRHYDPREYREQGTGGGTAECFYDATHCAPEHWGLVGGVGRCQDPVDGSLGRINTWIDKKCFDQHCDCTYPGETPQYVGTGWPSPSGCLHCLVACSGTNDGSACNSSQ